ncbi:MAG: TRAP transporter substrate-binding protein, partial [Rhizobiales bacterium]|nr:TRAP transporter substrate-binding protein [Hyphomicrobiales bacterium]
LAQGTTVWRMVTTWPRNAPGVGVNAQRFADRVGAMSAGRLTIDLAAAGELIPAFESLDAVQQGTADLCHSAPFFWLGKSEALNYFGSIPLGLMDSEIAAWLYFGGGMDFWEEAMAEFGIKPLYAGSSGISAGGWYRREINDLEDLKGLKLRMAGLGAEVMKRLGATPVLTPPSEVFQAMATGTVDAAELIGPWNDMAFGLFEVADYYYLPGFHEVGPTAEILINRQTWEGLTDDLRAIVETAAKATAIDYNADYRYHNATLLPSLVADHGVELRSFPDSINAAIGRTVMDVLRELGDSDDLTRRIHQSYMAFLRQADSYAERFDRPILTMRHHALSAL